MKFYDREKEIEILRRNWERTATHSLFTVMVGRRAVVAEVKRNSDRYSYEKLKEKFDTIKQEFGKYKDVQLMGLSMNEM